MRLSLIKKCGYALARVFVGILFIYAGSTKLLSPIDFADSIATYNVLPAYFINLLALGLPLFEIICGLSLVTGIHVRTSAFAIVIMLVIFAVALAVALSQGRVIDCGCFGESSWFGKTPFTALLRDLILLPLVVLVYIQALSRSTL